MGRETYSAETERERELRSEAEAEAEAELPLREGEGVGIRCDVIQRNENAIRTSILCFLFLLF